MRLSFFLPVVFYCFGQKYVLSELDSKKRIKQLNKGVLD